ncbi:MULTISPECIES: DUF5689 domain-containing protein [Bizionia]|uniref:DUF5689 domain-containing protein n=1 Tax=Bizionia algoritergicola TaxID=291187 RepID=A0A5D0R032_9FLAO|nr:MULTISPECIES: DUF5689 domain-containing protein [Bizionia]OBX23564.1 hypothetical protein BAA08_04225 [Bizionia sp. APA-3]TYB74903.1 hypothetical protein ES675_01840 [Bizionia algoritergicola]
MKTNKFLTLVLTVVASLAIVSCVQDDDYTIPTSLGDEENARLNTLLSTGIEISIADAKSRYTSDPNNDGDTTDAMPYIEELENIYIKGYVSSSDKSGNFFKEFFLQDSPTNPTTAIKIIINQVDLYNQFNFGREVYVSLKGLYIGEERIGTGIIAVGGETETTRFGTNIKSIGENRARTHIFRSPVTEDITPVNVNFADINGGHVGILVQVDGVEFADNLAGERYFDPMNDFDTKRRLQACTGFTYSTFQLETSGFANFKNELLPLGNGSITALVNKTFDGGTIILALNGLEGVNFDGSRCELLDQSNFTVVFEEDFVGGLNGWDVINTAGTREWYAASFGGVSYVRGSGYDGSNAVTMVSWLISPAFDFDAQDDEQMILEIADAFSDAGEEPLKAYYSNDYVAGADPTTANWTEVGASQIEGLPINGGFFDNIYDETGFIDLSAANGTGFIAFVYDSENAAISSTRDLGNVKILAAQ